MALIVEDGTGKTDAESYESVANITTYLTNHGEESDWTGLADDTAREKKARQATRFLDHHFATRWKGTRTSETQALDWPRAYVYDRDGYDIDDDVVPVQLKNALAILCERASTEDLIPDQANPGDIVRKRVRVGSIEQDISYAGSQSQEKFYRLAEALLDDLLEPSNTLSRA